MNNETLKLWAKTSPNADEPNAFHPLICHLTDVAAVTKIIWDKILPNATKRRIARAFGETDFDEANSDKIGRLVAFIAGLHDLGKCSPPFALRGKHIETQEANLVKQISEQKNKHSDYANRLHGKLQTIRFLKIYENTPFQIENSVPVAKDAPHGYVTTIELPEILESYGFNKNFAGHIGVLIGGHHGVFPNSDWRKNGRKAVKDNLGDENWSKARTELVETLAELLEIKPSEQNKSAKLDNANATIMILAGLVSVADWIGSASEYFQCAAEQVNQNGIKFRYENLKKYLKHAENRAETALKELGWIGRKKENSEEKFDEKKSPEEKFEKLFPFIDNRRHLQNMAIEISEELKTPGIAVIEAPTGEGKTEAAMFLADAWNTSLDQNGYYFALPTQATSNQMFARAADFLEKSFPERDVNLQLTHGHASLSAEFETLKEKHQTIIKDVFDDLCEGEECVPSVVAAEWFTYRKRGLLAPFGVGTVDQALMAVLQTKHVFVRLFGLAHKTVIIDEVHAYDAYMSTLLERLLEWLAALGSPVILLSATLPAERRNKLIEAYLNGLEIKESETVGEDKYPRISYATDQTIKIRHIKTSEKKRTLYVEKVDDYTEDTDGNFIERLKAKLKETGSDKPRCGCIAIICNTVQRSQDIYNELSKHDEFKGNADDGLPILDLLHSRFRFTDRDQIEKRVRLRFGKEGEKIKVTENGEETQKAVKRPDFAVLIATQIIEQSLDLDFDLMISDLAPVDLLLQRAGRLQRHERRRNEEFKLPTLWIIQPKIKDDGLPNFENSVVYDEHILLRTWLILQKKKKIEIPDEVENLIEAVYDARKSFDNSDENLKDFWQKSLADWLKANEEDDKQADYRLIKRPIYSRHISGIFASNLEEDSPEIHKTLQAVTRLTEPTANVICLWEKDGKVFLDANLSVEINLDKKPHTDLTKELLRRSVSVSKKSVVFELLKNGEVPKSWQNSSLLQHHRLLKFDENRKCEKFGHTFCLDENLGLQIF